MWPDLLAVIFRYLLDRPNFSTVFCESLRGIVINEKFLGDFCDALHLSAFEKIALNHLALADAENLEMRTSGQNFSTGQIEKFRENPASVYSAELIQNIIMFLYRSEPQRALPRILSCFCIIPCYIFEVIAHLLIVFRDFVFVFRDFVFRDFVILRLCDCVPRLCDCVPRLCVPKLCVSETL
ncbi:hypothetical protein Dsin_024811 [Dipteronia sinensis]|uniref:Uncharacterized protein n=1 Tax=Dipteronia sinensis TaxID=43782 RepID=A0AAE0DWJ5_9ROSI|nr:hypothetical protein Dsin_024811 [Dipteronia sinensis]